MSTSSEKTPGQPSGGAVGWKTVSVFVSSTFDDKNQIPEASPGQTGVAVVQGEKLISMDILGSMRSACCRR